MKMSFQQYIDNPMGKRNAVFSKKDLFKQLYTEKFDNVFLREAGKINYALYVDEKNDRYIIHIKVPSETVKNFYYDAVIMFYSDDPAVKSSSSLQEYYVKFFSNDPAFVYTYLKVFLDNDMFIEDLKPKASKLALKQDPKVTNPYKIPGYSKILYFAFLFMKNKNLFAKFMYTSYGSKYSAKKLVDSVEHTDTKIASRQELGEKQAAEIAKQKKEEKKASQPSRQIDSPSGNIRGVKQTKTIGTVGSVKSMNTTKTVKTTSRISKRK